VATGLGGFWTRFIVGLVLILAVALHILLGRGKDLSEVQFLQFAFKKRREGKAS